MKELEIDLPRSGDSSIVARIKRLHFYSVREEFLDVWKEHEQFLLVYEERVKKALLRQARIVDHNITEEETEAFIANNTTSLFVGNVSQSFFDTLALLYFEVESFNIFHSRYWNKRPPNAINCVNFVNGIQNWKKSNGRSQKCVTCFCVYRHWWWNRYADGDNGARP